MWCCATCFSDGERPESFCAARFPRTKPKLALPWFVFKTKERSKWQNKTWLENEWTVMWKLKTQVKRNIPAGFPSLTTSRYSFIFFATNKDSLSIMTTLESFRVKVTRFGPRVWYHEICLTLWFSCNKNTRLNSTQQNTCDAHVLKWHRVSLRRTLQMFLNPIN